MTQNTSGQIESFGFRATGNINVAGDLFVAMDSGSGTTVVVDGNNKFLKSSSSQRYKQQIQEMPVEAKILSMPLKTFKYDYDVQTYGNEAPTLYGYIAEELDAQGLDDFVIYETLEDGTKRPDAVRYDSIFAALHKTVQNQASIISSLEARLAALEDRVQ
jgi:CII-binding regulator of phage lambda lysogenization HflD